MVFSSIIFLAAFLPIIFLLYYIPIPLKGNKLVTYRNIILVIASLVFYAFGEPVYVFLMIGSVFINYIFGLLLSDRKLLKSAGTSQDHADGQNTSDASGSLNNSPKRKIIITIAVIINVAILGIFKYAGFFVSTINGITGLSLPVPQIALPIGISFFTFQAMSYVCDVYRDASMYQKSYWKVLLYISFFPQLIAGPIVRYHDIDLQLTNRGKDGAADSLQMSAGFLRFSKGLAKKVIIANAMGYIADKVYGLDISIYGGGVAWMGAICYVFQIFYDFSGYSDMAIGLAKVFGFEFLENFDHPYSSLSIKEFWRRWHISLSTWFKEYVYIPLGGNRKGRLRTEINKIIVFFLTGFWHGANWTFVIWGLFHGLFLTLEDTILPVAKLGIKKSDSKAADTDKKYDKKRDVEDDKEFARKIKVGDHSIIAPWAKVIRNLYVWLVAIVGFVFFRADSISYAGKMLKQMFTGFSPKVGGSVALGVVLEEANPYNLIVLILAIAFSYPISKKFADKFSKKKWWEGALMIGSLLLLIICILSLASAAYNPFIYFRF
ncbi:MAG: MBOAT family protein [Eubacterium sp.]|nr:MBOAT family protein [Eubacterium sp.]